jgi:hypothetical protein
MDILWAKNVPKKHGVVLAEALAECHADVDFVLACLGQHMTIMQEAEARRIKRTIVQYGKVLKDEYEVRASFARSDGPAICVGPWQALDSFVGTKVFREFLEIVRSGGGHRDDVRLYVRKVRSAFLLVSPGR